MQHDETNEGITFVRDDHAHFFYTIPDGWQRVTDDGDGSGPSSTIASTTEADADEERKASVFAGTLEDLPSGPGGLAPNTLRLAHGLAQLSDARANAEFSDETTRELTIDGHPAATASLRADFASDTGALYMRVTVVAIADGYYSYLVGTTHPQSTALRVAVDSVHNDLIVAVS